MLKNEECAEQITSSGSVVLSSPPIFSNSPSLYVSLQCVSWWVTLSGLDHRLCSQREEIPMRAFIPIASHSLSLSLQVKCTGILKWGRYHCLIKDSLTWEKWVNHHHDFRQRKGEVYFGDKKCNFFPPSNCCYVPQGVRSRSFWVFSSLWCIPGNV